ncbi:MAG: hypothetical protein K0Q79_2432 [Flavipsychrobacter sp.]|jgi:uncharacterized membrane protein YdcZ (DUF606 family)|nr:hypothetical protein [Flavipsychrobacter sp.]
MVFICIVHKYELMRVLGIVLVIIGVLMILFNSIGFTTKKEILDVGPLEINKTEHRTVGWPLYAGAVVCIAGAAVLLVARKQQR